MACNCGKSNRVKWSAIKPDGSTVGTYDSVVLAQKALADSGVARGTGAVKPVSAK